VSLPIARSEVIDPPMIFVRHGRCSKRGRGPVMKRRPLRLIISLLTLCAFVALTAVPHAARAGEPLDPAADEDDIVQPPAAFPAPSTYAPPAAVPYAPAPSYQLRYEKRTRWGLLASGAIVFGVVWSLNLLGAYVSAEGSLAVPLVGPLLFATRHNQRAAISCAPSYSDIPAMDCGRPDNTDRSLTGLLVIDALAQATGIALLLAGAISKRRVAVFELAPGVRMSLVPAGAGLAAVGTF
jgi:hypothetical protein